ncbi:MAG: DUF2182 domain-containing protein [Vicinamibacterales bacterium]|nr:DUF2182 domain-containing protein [Vicinamibacterales bacterium]
MGGEAIVERILRRDAAVVLGALAAVTALGWWYVVRLAAGMDMGGMDMHGWQMVSTGFGMTMAPAMEPWTPAVFLLMFVMWAVMMVGMMVPSAAPLILLYTRAVRQADSQGTPMAASGFFTSGYLVAWTGFALAATTVQWLLQRAALLSPEMAAAGTTTGAVVLLLAGAYQWSSLKDVCLTHCRSPLQFLVQHGGFRRDARGALALGLRHGIYCVGCCWVLMALLFVGGIMNLAWIAGLAILVLLEKVAPVGRALARLSGVVLVAAGVWGLLHG